MLLLGIVTISIIDIINDDLWIEELEFRVWLAMILGLITLLFAFMRQKHNDMSIFLSHFDKFNERYNNLNGDLNEIHRITSSKKLQKKYPDRHPFDVLMLETQTGRMVSKSWVENKLDDYLNL